MKYYQIDVSAEPKIIGVTNGIHQIEINKKAMQEDDRFAEFLTLFNSKNNDFWDNQNKLFSMSIPMLKAKPMKKAKITDIMGYTPNIGFFNDLYSEKYINIIKAFNIGNYVIFDVSIENVDSRYYLLFNETIQTKDIKFENSKVYTGHKVLKNVEYFSFENYDDYWAFKQNNPLAKFEKVTISKEYMGRDIVKIQGLTPFYSDKLIDFLLDCGITGLEISYKNSIQLEFV